MHTEHAQPSRRSHSPLSMPTMRRFTVASTLACILLLGGVNAGAQQGKNSNTSIDQRAEHDIFSPALAAAAFKVGLASVAERGGHGGQQLERGHQRIKREQRRKRAPQLLSDVLGEEGDVLDLAAPVNVLLQGGTLTSGSISTTSVYPTTYVTSENGIRATVTDRVTVYIVPTPAASPSSSPAQAISSRTPLNGNAAQSSSSTLSLSRSSPSSTASSSSQDATSEKASSSSSRDTESTAPTSTRSSSSASSSSLYRGTESSTATTSSDRETSSSSISLSRPSSTLSSSEADRSSSIVPTSTRASQEDETTSTSRSSSSTRLSVSLTEPTSESLEASSTVTTSSSETPSSVASSTSESSSSSPSSSREETSSSIETTSSSPSSSREETSSSIETTSSSSSRAEPSSTIESSSAISSSDATPSSATEITSRTPLVPASNTVESSTSVATSYSLSSLTLPLPTYDTTSSESVESTIVSSVFDSSSPTGVLLGSTSSPSASASSIEESTITRQTELPSISSVPSGSNQTTIISEEEQSTRSTSPITSRASDTTRSNTGESTSQVEQSLTPTAESSFVSPTSGSDDSTTSDVTSVPESNTISTPTREAGSDITSATDGPSQNGTTTVIPSSSFEISRTITSTPTLSPSGSFNVTDPITTSRVVAGNGTTTASDEGTLSTSPTVAINSTSEIVSMETGVETSTSDPYAWVPTSTLLANSAEPTTTESSTVLPSDILSDGEDASDEESTSTSSSFAPFPSEWPSVIVPTNAKMMSPSTVPQGNTYISILFNDQLKWSWLCANGDASAQVFAFMPSLISTAINITTSQVLTDKLVAYQPDNYDGSSGTILSVYLGYVPTSYVDALSAAIKAPNSAFYTKSSGIAAQLAKVVNPTLPITAYAQQGVSNTAVDASNLANADLATSNSNASEKKKTIIIAVVTSIGVFLLGLLAFFAIKAARKNSKGSSAMRTPQMQNNLRGFQLQGDRGDNSQSYNHHVSGTQQPPMMSQHGQSRNVYMPPSQSAHRTSALSRVYGFATGQPVYATQRSQRQHSEDHQQNPFRISGYSDASSSDRSGSDHSHGSSAFTHSSDGSGYQQQHWTGPRRNASQHRQNNTSGRSSSIDFNAVEPDQVRNSWWRFSDGFGRAFSPSNNVPHSTSATTGTSGQQFNHHHQSASQFGDLIATSPISASSGRAHVRNSTRRLNIQRGPRGDYSSAISRPQMQENSLML